MVRFRLQNCFFFSFKTFFLHHTTSPVRFVKYVFSGDWATLLTSLSNTRQTKPLSSKRVHICSNKANYFLYTYKILVFFFFYVIHFVTVNYRHLCARYSWTRNDINLIHALSPRKLLEFYCGVLLLLIYFLLINILTGTVGKSKTK